MNLIDKNKLKADIIRDDEIRYGTVFQHIILYLENAPTIEAMPVRHGEWYEIVTHNGCTPDYDCVCSRCGKSGIAYYKYCPHCGAKMDLEELE